MENNTQKALQVYGLLGKALCGCAGAIVGFVFGGPLLALPGIFAGIIGGHYLEKSLVKTSL
jgi:hypothetical protein